MRDAEEKDLKWLWLDYKQGTELPFVQGMNTERFRKAAHDFFAAYADAKLLFAPTSRAGMPVGIIVAEFRHRRLMPHAFWFNWATRRNKVESVAYYVTMAAENYLVLITSSTKNKPMFERLVKYGIIRSVGVIKDWFWNGLDEKSDDDEAHLYQGVDRGDTE